jgi:1-acyl-sn-glycerol-3-phosphate acyltransferase
VAAASIDRHELLDAADRGSSPLLRLFAAITRTLRPSAYGHKVGEMGMYWHSEEIGPFGFDPVFWARVKPFFQLMYDKYWRIELRGAQNIPAEGRALLVANHSGSLPWDGIMLRLAIENAAASARPVHFLVEDFVFHFPFLGPFVNRVGGVRACQDNATRLLSAGNLVGVFPEGVKGIGKLFRQRYQLQRFGRGGFVKLALRTESPIVPVAVVGAEEIHPMLAKLGWLARSLKLPYVPVTPTFPWLGPLGLVPLPSKWLIRFGEPIHFERVDPEAPDAQTRTMDMVEQVRESIQQMIDELVEERKHPFFGP